MTSSSQRIDVLLNQLKFRDKNRVKADLTTLEQSFKTLMPKAGTLARNDGTIEHVLVLSGTIPIFYAGVQYNIPLDIFILEQYPHRPPEIYIRPTSNMTIKSNHKNVDMQGLVYLPYLHTWNASSSLVQLVQTMSSVFSAEPPLFSKPSEPTPNPYNRYQPTVTTPTIQQVRPQETTQESDQVKEQREKDSLINQITYRLQEEILLAQTRLKSEIEQEFKSSNDLKQSEEEIEKYQAELDSVKGRLRAELASVGHQDEKLEVLRLSKDQPLTSEEQTRQLIARLIPYDGISEQLIQLQAEHDAVDDTMYFLERALQRNHPSLPLDVFLNKTRELAAKQFTCRAHIRKIESHINRSFSTGGR